MTEPLPGPVPASRLLAADVVRAGTLGLRNRRTRALLSALGVAIGIAALVAVLGVTYSSESALLAEIDRLGTNLLTVTNGQTLQGQEAELPAYATAMIGRVPGVQRAAPTALLPAARVYRTGLVPVYDTGGLAARAAGPSLLAVLGGTRAPGPLPDRRHQPLPRHRARLPGRPDPGHRAASARRGRRPGC